MNQIGLRSVSSLFASTLTFYGHTVMNQIGLRSVSSLFASTLTFYGHTVMNQIGLSDLCHHLCLYTYILWSYSNEPDWTQICVTTLCLYTYILWSYSNEPDWTVRSVSSSLPLHLHSMVIQ